MEVASIYLNSLITNLVKKGASSLHLTVGTVPVIRVDGSLIPLRDEEVVSADIVNQIVNSFIQDDEKEQLEKNREVVITKIFNNNFRFRVNIFYQKNLISLSFNYIPNVIRNYNDLGLPDQLRNSLFKKSGLIMVAGSHDSGKTSTIASLIEEINKKEKRYIITLENPIEYVFVNKQSVIEQRQVGRDVISYEKGLEACLDEDVDVVYLDEIFNDRLEKTVPMILELAAGNAVVIVELNAESSISAIEKILHMAKTESRTEAFRYSLADVLVGVVAQKLIPRRGGGMVMAMEVVMVNSAVRSLIREGKFYQFDSIVQTSRGEGMQSMKRSISDLINRGEISQEEADRIKVYD